MKYEFICKNCGSTKIVERDIKEGPPSEIVCKDCGGVMKREWKSSSIYIPEYFKAGSEEMSPQEISRRLNRSRPSGKRRVYY